jgi:PIN domain nuclease of toxin-antitoxin system
MRYLLDTHVLLWWAENSPKLKPRHRALISDGSREILFSVVSVWEATIKASQGKLALPLPPKAFFQRLAAQGPFEVLPIQLSHAAEVYSLPQVHTDPFDRLLIAQARSEGMTLISEDPVFAKYDLPGLVG